VWFGHRRSRLLEIDRNEALSKWYALTMGTEKPPDKPDRPTPPRDIEQRPMVSGTPPMTAEERAKAPVLEVRVPKRRARRR
jgi:hypothetical protein